MYFVEIHPRPGGWRNFPVGPPWSFGLPEVEASCCIILLLEPSAPIAPRAFIIERLARILYLQPNGSRPSSSSQERLARILYTMKIGSSANNSNCAHYNILPSTFQIYNQTENIQHIFYWCTSRPAPDRLEIICASRWILVSIPLHPLGGSSTQLPRMRSIHRLTSNSRS